MVQDRAVGWTERLFVVLALFFLSGAVFGLVLHWAEAETIARPEGDAITRYKLAFVYAVSGALLVRHLHLLPPLIAANKWLLAFVAYALASTLWSVDSAGTLLRALSLAGTTAFGLYLGLRFTPREIVRLVALSFALCGLVSILFIALAPHMGIMWGFHAGAWRGAFYHKNELGNVMSWAAIACFLLALTERRRRWVYWTGVLIAVGLVLRSQSATFLTSVSLLPFGALLIWVCRLEPRVAIGLGSLTVALAIAVIPFLTDLFESILLLLGRSPNLTGRVELWDLLAATIRERPWFGHGYAAFWLGSTAPAASIREVLGWSVGHSHNVWMETWLGLGAVGVALLAISVATTMVLTVRNMRDTADAGPRMHGLFLFAVIVMNIVESDLLKQPSFQWALYVATAAGASAMRRSIGVAQSTAVSVHAQPSQLSQT